MESNLQKRMNKLKSRIFIKNLQLQIIKNFKNLLIKISRFLRNLNEIKFKLNKPKFLYNKRYKLKLKIIKSFYYNKINL